ncbi:hypothetical protein ACJMK2_013220 [Sinanodonta woodiana]|uniref:Peptidase M12B domain-containing protein n=1 Tax=Sinanodonta woodiana TaxID=1069815 RepID=A0ABD3UWT2_SINWO
MHHERVDSIALSIDTGLVDQDGNNITHQMILGRWKEVKPLMKTFALRNGMFVEEPSGQDDPATFAFFRDLNGTDTGLLLECIESSCKSSAVFYNGSDAYIMVSANESTFATKLQAPKKSFEMKQDERQIGLSKNGSPLPVPLSLRRKREAPLTDSMRQSIRRRRKRQATQVNVVELIFVVDYRTWKFWWDRAIGDEAEANRGLRLYLLLVTNMMNLRYKSLSQITGVSLEFMINGVIIAKGVRDSPWADNNLQNGIKDADEALDKFTVWTFNNRALFPPHDHVMGVTRNDLGAVINGIMYPDPIGIAFKGSMCKVPTYSTSIIEDPGWGLLDWAAAHEIGHSLGSSHDGGIGCNDGEFYLMSKYGGGVNMTGRESNPWTLSSCAAAIISSFIDSMTVNCLQENTFNTTLMEIYKNFSDPGLFLPISSQCQIQFNNEQARICFPLESKVCSEGAWCWNPNDPNYCYQIFPRQGSQCGVMMRCDRGKCVNSSELLPTCPPGAINPINVVNVTENSVGQDAPVLLSHVSTYAGTAYSTRATAADVLSPEETFCLN